MFIMRSVGDHMKPIANLYLVTRAKDMQSKRHIFMSLL